MYEIDNEIVTLVKALNDIGWETLSSCDGHSITDGYIWCKYRLVILSKERSPDLVRARYLREFNDMAESNEKATMMLKRTGNISG